MDKGVVNGLEREGLGQRQGRGLSREVKEQGKIVGSE